VADFTKPENVKRRHNIRIAKAKMQYNGILEELESLSNLRAIDGMAKYGAKWTAYDTI